MENNSKTFKYTKWWLRIIGTYYLILSVSTLLIIASGHSEMFRHELSFPLDDNGFKAFIYGAVNITTIILSLGIAAIIGSFRPHSTLMLIFAILFNEFTGILARFWAIYNDYVSSSQGYFAGISMIFILTGLMIIRRELKKTSP